MSQHIHHMRTYWRSLAGALAAHTPPLPFSTLEEFRQSLAILYREIGSTRAVGRYLANGGYGVASHSFVRNHLVAAAIPLKSRGGAHHHARAHLVTYHEQTRPLQQWLVILGLPQDRLSFKAYYQRIFLLQWHPNRALDVPIRMRKARGA